VDNYAIYEHFIKPAEILTKTSFNKNDIDIILLESQFEQKDQQHQHRAFSGLCRAMFIEFLCRLAKYLYTDNSNDRSLSFKKPRTLIVDREYDKTNM
jgi:hypothetical protein